MGILLELYNLRLRKIVSFQRPLTDSLYLYTKLLESTSTMRRTNLLSLALLVSSGEAYIWPNKYDQLDDLLYLQSGYVRNGQLSDRMYAPICSTGPRN
jgi:hypothetical protein